MEGVLQPHSDNDCRFIGLVVAMSDGGAEGAGAGALLDGGNVGAAVHSKRTSSVPRRPHLRELLWSCVYVNHHGHVHDAP